MRLSMRAYSHGSTRTDVTRVLIEEHPPALVQSAIKIARFTRVAVLSLCALVAGCAVFAGKTMQAATASPSAVTWAAVAVGSKGGQKVVTLTNSSTSAINISNITFSGANPGDFSVFSKTCGATLAAGASCTANILFGPTATGSRTAILNFADSDTNSPQTVSMSGLGTSGVVAASPSSLAFGSADVGSTTAAQSVMLSNGVTSLLAISGVSITGTNASDFILTGTTCSSTLSVGAACSASVAFKPTASGTRTASLTFTDSASGSPQTVSLSGVGGSAPATASVSPTSLAFPGTSVGASSVPQTVTLTNGPGSSIDISSVAVAGTNASDFVVSGNTCGPSLAISASCTVTIIFKPGAAGARSANLTFVDSATNSPQAVALSGSGSSMGATSVSPSGLTWAAVAVGNKSGQKTVTLTNGNGATINISSFSFTGANPGDFSVFSKTCGSTLAPSTSCSLNILFAPTGTGTRTATLNLVDSDSNSPQTVGVSGLGTSGVVAATPATVSFGSTTLGTSAAAQSITLSNGNTSPITISSVAIAGANASDFVLAANSCGATLSVNGNCSATIYFRPTTAGARIATLSFADSATGSPQSVALSGIGGTLLTISPLNPSVEVNGTVHFTSTVPVTWVSTCGSIAGDGTFTAPAAQAPCSVTATATDGSGQTASTPITLSAASLDITPDDADLHALNTQTFTANQPVTWSASCGTISSSGVFTAPATEGTCTITATTDNSLTATATVSVELANYTARKGGGGLLGARTDERALTPSNVNASTFGLSWTANVDGWVNAQPLYMNALTVNGAPHNVVFIATANDSVYALDADTGAQLWQVSLIPGGASAVVSSTVGFTSAPLIGILGTPVIDPSTSTMYVVAETSEQSGTYFPHRLHALDLATGSEKFGGPVLVNDPQMAPIHKLQRTGLALANGNVYFGIGSMQDMQPYHGLVFAFDATTLAQEAVWDATPTGVEGGIWMGGAPPSVDEDGNLYVTTGNGTLDGATNFGEAAVKLSPGLQLLDYFAPYNYADYNAGDIDLGSGTIMVVPHQSGSHPHELIACGKPTPVYVLDRDNLGQLGASADNIIQRLDNQVGAYATTTKSVQACFTSPAMWGQNVYFGGKYDVLKMFTLDPNTGLLSTTPASQGTLAYGYPGADPVISANGAANGIVWSLDSKTNALIANDAGNLANTLFTGTLPAPVIRWTVPTVVNGHVYVGEQGKVFGFGLK